MKYIYLILILLAMSSCKSCEESPILPKDGRTVLAVILANNNLNSYGLADINEMESAWQDNLGGQLYVFLNTTKNSNILYEIVHDENPVVIASKIVKEYPSTIDPCNADFIRSIFDELKAIAPAKSYGMFLWSHGSGWLPKGSSNPLQSQPDSDDNNTTIFSKIGLPEPSFTPAEVASTLENQNTSQFTFGDNQSFNHSTIETYQLADAFAGLNLEYIYFDACHMASVEVAYALRNCAKYTISSASETLATGAPYDQITRHMFGTVDNTIEMARQFYEYYAKQSGFMQSGTISVVENKKLEPAAAQLKTLVTANPAIPFTSIQQYGRYLGSGADYRNIFYDLTDFVDKTWSSSNPEGVAQFKTSINNAVLYQASTPKLFNTIEVKNHSGLTLYIPKSSQTKTLKIYRDKYQWATDSGLGAMVN